ncbi:MAG: glycosyl hydrolase family 8 [Acidobacteriota bacterium]|nr:glycosyl hydrolase family 8 [Acidobacteriota bacterium]
MRKLAPLLLAVIGSLFLCKSLHAQATLPAILAGPRRPFPQHTSYAPGTLRLDRRTQAQQDDDARVYYDAWKSSFLVQAGNASDGSPLYRITVGSGNPSRTVSEGQGYGMMIVAFMAGYDRDAQTVFDGLWRFARKYPSSIDSRLMSFEVPFDPLNFNSAFDGDCDIAYALLLADAQWGSTQAINYRAEAQKVIAGILASTIGPDSRLPMLGDWVDAKGETYNQYTPRSSDFMLDNFRAFERANGDPVWARVVAEVQAVITSLQTNYSPNTGLIPDFIVPTSKGDHTAKPAPPNFLEAATDGAYAYNAGRVPWRLGADALLNNDPVSLAQTRKITQWALATTGGNPYQIRAGYALDGTPINANAFTIFFAAPLGVAAMTDPAQQEWFNQIYDSVYARHEDYYEDSVTLLCLLVMTHNTWSPSIAKRRAVRPS